MSRMRSVCASSALIALATVCSISRNLDLEVLLMSAVRHDLVVYIECQQRREDQRAELDIVDERLDLRIGGVDFAPIREVEGQRGVRGGAGVVCAPTHEGRCQ